MLDSRLLNVFALMILASDQTPKGMVMAVLMTVMAVLFGDQHEAKESR